MGRQSLHIADDFVLESGAVLKGMDIAYHTYGEMNADKSNVVWVCHAMTANSDAADWWHGLVGPDRLLDPAKYFIVCANILGSCYGTTGPLNTNPETGEPYYLDFPLVTVRDMVQAHKLLRKHLGIEKIDLCLGGSLGGQQVLEWALLEPEVFDKIAPIATNPRHSPWGIGYNEAQRMALEADGTWGDKNDKAGAKGLEAARAIAMLSYRTYESYWLTQLDDNQQWNDLKASSYQRYQGQKLEKRFNAYSYWYLSKAMDSHNLLRGRSDNLEEVLKGIKATTVCVGVKSDGLFPIREQQQMAVHIPRAVYQEIDSIYGHDGFLLEYEQLTRIIGNLMRFG